MVFDENVTDFIPQLLTIFLCSIIIVIIIIKLFSVALKITFKKEYKANSCQFVFWQDSEYIHMRMLKSVFLPIFYYSKTTNLHAKEGAQWPRTKRFLLQQTCIYMKIAFYILVVFGIWFICFINQNSQVNKSPVSK